MSTMLHDPDHLHHTTSGLKCGRMDSQVLIDDQSPGTQLYGRQQNYQPRARDSGSGPGPRRGVIVRVVRARIVRPNVGLRFRGIGPWRALTGCSATHGLEGVWTPDADSRARYDLGVGISGRVSPPRSSVARLSYITHHHLPAGQTTHNPHRRTHDTAIPPSAATIHDNETSPSPVISSHLTPTHLHSRKTTGPHE